MTKLTEERLGKIQVLLNPVLLFSLFILLSIGGLLFMAFSLSNKPNKATTMENAVQIDGDRQLVTIKAKNGFDPNMVNLDSTKKTTVKVQTDKTFDCSNTMVISKLGITKELPPTGEVEFDIPPQESGSKVTAVCSMGHFTLDFNFL